MSLLKVDKSKLVEPKIKTTPQNVKEAQFGAVSCYNELAHSLPSTVG